MRDSRYVAGRALVSLMLAAPIAQPACDPQPPPGSSGEVFTTDDGVRFRADVIATGLEVPWSLSRSI